MVPGPGGFAFHKAKGSSVWAIEHGDPPLKRMPHINLPQGTYEKGGEGMIQLPYIIAGVVIILVIVIIFTGYKKAPPDTAFIISGLRKKIIIGKASVKLPFLERMDKLSLKLIAIDVKTTNAVPTAGLHQYQVDAAVNVKISSEPSGLPWRRRTS